ncbi:hypothetical protein [Salinarchaeum laminariae]|uniref:hypothetical protein n=1 Tax=Salinarchaeum laminariae TaxID=869888 RepID=UPI0020C121A9|nr:hypothetical protein [Salinarchaeum laminariae]
MDPPESAPRCLVLFATSLFLLTFGIGYAVVVGTTFADFAVIVGGLIVGWVAFFYCLGHLSSWAGLPTSTGKD